MLSQATRRGFDTVQPNVKKFLNSYFWDIELSEQLETGKGLGKEFCPALHQAAGC